MHSTTKRLLALLLALIFCVSLFPSALAEEAGEGPAFTVQPVSGSHAAGESYLLTWALNQIPDRLELAREATEEERVGEDEPVLVPVQELDPESSELELTAPEEETVFRLRAFYGEETLLSEPFTVTEEAAEDDTSSGAGAPPSPQGEGTEEEGLEPLSPGEAGTAPLAEEPEEPAGDEPEAEPAEPTPDEPLDDTHYFTVQPQDGTVAPEGYYHITWATNFTPTRVEIIHYTGYGGYKVLDTITSGLSTSMGYDITYEVAFAEDNANLLTDHGYAVWAYYTGSDKVLSDDFYINVTPYGFTSNPSGGIINQGGTLQLSWRTNFRPLSIKIQYNYSQGWKLCYEMPYSQANIYSNSYTLNYSDAVTGTWRILAYYGSGASDYVSSNEFFISCTGYSFTQSPSGGAIVPEGSLKLSWKTDFTPTKIQIGYMQTTGSPGSSGTFLPRVTLTSGLSQEMSRTLPYDTLASSSTWYIAAWYGENKLVYSAPVNISITRRSFTLSPAGGSVEPESSLTLSWKTNFTPTRIELRYYRDYVYIGTPEWVSVKSIDTDLAREMSCPLSYNESTTGTWAVWAYYGEQLHVTSETFSIQQLGYSVTKPEDISIAPGETEMLHWESNFVPYKVEIYRAVPGLQETTYLVDTLTTDLSRSMSYPVTYDESYAPGYFGAQRWYLKVWWADGSSSYRTSADFHVNLVDCAFTASPSGGTVILGNYLTLRWATNFTPVRVELGYLNGDHWVKKAAIGTGFAREMDYQLSYYEAYTSDAWRVRAFYGTGTNDFVSSEAYSVQKRELTFSAIPTSGYIYPWTTRTLQWTTNFEPVKVQIGYLSGSTWITKATVTSGLQMSMKYTLDYSHAVTSDNWRIRAFYGTESNEYLQSDSFSVTKLTAYDCGDNLTATYADGVLTFSGSGAMYDFSATDAPWKGLRTSITKVVIPEGVTYIGKSAFYLCTHLTDVTLPASVTTIGSSAFSTCTRLKTVRYGGLHAQWDDVSVAGSNSYLTDADFIYVYRTGTLSGTDVGWILDGEYDLLIITGYGTSQSHVTGPWLNWAPYIQTIEVEYGITGIWEEAFRECTGVKKVYLPDTVTLVDDAAFNDCDGITDVYFDGPLSKWNQITIRPYNDPLTDATLHTAVTPHQLTDDVAWSVDDAGLLRIYMTDEFGGSGDQNYIPNYNNTSDVPWIQEGYKEAITAVHVEAGIRRIGGYAFCGLINMENIEIAASVTSIGQRAFLNCSSMTSIVLPSGITSIAGYTFQNCSSLTEIRLPSGTTIGEYTFAGCSSLKKVWLPDNITAIPKYFFQNCSKLVMVSMPGTVSSVAINAFYGCSALKTTSGHVYFDGTSAQFAAMTLETGNGNLTSAGHIHFTPEELPVNAANFPDENFRNYVAASFNTDGVTVNGVAYLSDAEIAAATELDMDWVDDVASIQGIEYLTELTYLNLQGVSSLSSADLRENTALIEVSIGGSLTEIRLEGLRYLQKLYLGDNRLTELDLDGLTNLKTLSIYGNLLTELDVSDFALTRLDVENMPLTELNLGQQPNLSILYCYGTQLTELDLSGCPLICQTLQSGTLTEYSTHYRFYKKINNKDCWLYIDKDLICFTDHDGIPIDEAHFPDLQFRRYVARFFDTNRSGTLSAAEIAEAREIDDEDNDYGSLQGIEYLTYLEEILLDAAPSLTNVDLRANTRLVYVDFSNCGNLAELHVEGLSGLQDLFVCGNQLTELDLTGITNLKSLDVYGNPLSALDLGEQPELCRLLCYDTQIVALDLRGCPKLLSAIAIGERTETADYVQYLLSYVTGWLRVDPDMELIGIDGIPVDAEHFPDPNFRGYVSVNFDTNHSGWLTEDEIACAQIIYCGAEEIETLQGVEYFPELLELGCEDNLITELDLSANTKLTDLDCSYNQLTQLSLAGLTELTWLSCEGNPLTELDVSAQKLVYFYCQGTSLSALDLSGQTELRILSCYGTNIVTLDLSSCPWLQTAATEGERTETADYAQYKFSSTILRVNKDTQLLGFEGIRVDEAHFPDPVFRAYVSANFDTSRNGYLDDAEIAAATQIEVDCMGIESLQGIEYFTVLTSLACADNALTELDLSTNSLLVSLQCYENQLTALDLSANTELTYVDCDDNPDLETLNLGGLTQLAYLDVSGCNLTGLDLSDCALTYLECDHNPLETLILGQQEALESLYCYAVELQELDISGCPILADAWLTGTHTEYSWGLQVNGSEGLGGYMELDKDQTVVTGTEPDHTPGDINGDGKVSNKDVTALQRYIKYKDVTVVEAALDVNGDGKVTNKDVTALQRWIKYKDVTIY